MNDAEKALLFRSMRAVIEGQLLLMRDTGALKNPVIMNAYTSLIRDVLTTIQEVEARLANNNTGSAASTDDRS